MRLIARRDTAHEDAFLSRYKALAEHALKLTRGNRDVANDLLHDTFVYFTEAKPALDQVENLDAYLYSVLRHLHFACLRKALRDPIGELAAIEFESAELTLRAAPASNRLYVCDQLLRICEVALAGKDGSRPFCLLLLRFFHGYYLDELVRVAGNSDNTIRKGLREAQHEMRTALAGPPSEGQRQKGSQKDSWKKHLVLDGKPEAFLRSLRELLLHSAQASCPSRSEIQVAYSAMSMAEIRTELLSHLVVCARCLDRVNSLLQIPLLAHRNLEDFNDQGRKPKGGSGIGAGFNLSGARRRRDSKIHHEPNKLIIRINGDERAVHDLGQEFHHFVLKLSADEQVHLVEVVSKQDVALLTFVLDNAQAFEPVEWRRVLEMTSGRVLETTIRYGETWPSVEVVYRNPSLSQATAEAGHPPLPTDKLFSTPMLEPESWIERLRQRFFPAWLLAPGLIVLVVALAWYGIRVQRPGAATLLGEAETAEVQAEHQAVLHRVYDYQEFDSAGRQLVSGKVDSWVDADGHQSAHRLLRADGALIAGAWSSKDGKTVRVPATSSQGQPWEYDAVAAVIDQIIQVKPESKPHVDYDGDTVTFRAEVSPISEARLVRAVLVLRRRDLHATDQRLWLRRDDGTLVEARLHEVSYERVPSNRVDPSVFAPPLESGHRLRPGNGAVSPMPAADDLSHLEIAVLSRLHALKADTGNVLLSVERQDIPKPSLDVTAVFPTTERQNEVFNALLPLEQADKRLHLSICSGEDASPCASRAKLHAHGRPQELQLDLSQTQMPAETRLREYYGAQGLTGDKLKAAMQSYCEDVLAQSSSSLQDAAALDRLVHDFSRQQIMQLSPAERQQWIALMQDHATSMRSALDTLGQRLALIFPRQSPNPDSGNDKAPAADYPALQRGIRASALQVASLNRQLVTEFSYAAPSISTSAGANQTMPTPASLSNDQLWLLLNHQEQAAAAIGQTLERLATSVAQNHAPPQ